MVNKMEVLFARSKGDTMNNFFCKFLENLVNVFIAVLIAVLIGLVLGGLIVGVVALFEWNLPFSPFSNIVIFGVLVALVWTVFDTLRQKF